MGLYTDLEDKWYDLVDSIGAGGIIDKIDSVVPSFMLFIGIIAIILIFLITSFVISGPRNFEAEILVLSNLEGNPVPGATITLSADCFAAQGLKNSGTTGSNGKLSLTICGTDSFKINVTKDGYKKNSSEVSITEGQSVPITLEKIITAKNFNAKIVDESGEIITNSNLKMVCANNPINKREFPESPQKVQPAGGFDFDLISGCSEIQLIATAQGYTDSKGNPSATHTINQDEENYTFEMREETLNGNLEFDVQVDGKPAVDATISITSDDYPTITLITDESGTAEKTGVPAGDYRYVLIAKSGASDANSFSLSADETKQIIIRARTPSNVKKLYVKIIDNAGNIIPGAKVSTFTMPDGNFYIEDTANSGGILQRALIDKNYSAVVKKIGYQATITPIILKKESEEPQEITLNSGGGTIKANIFDETGTIVKGANVSLKISSFAGVIENGLSDSNGTYEFRY
ncbi:MAG: carboxypeptidase-like regulatory domain-containing protein, partial [archaeon]